jgi:hypothetical protein
MGDVVLRPPTVSSAFFERSPVLVRLRFPFPFTVTAVAALALSTVAPSVAAQLPAHAVPAGLQAVEGPGGGRILEGTLPGGSTAGSLRAGVDRARDYFDAEPELTSIVQSRDGRVTMAQFRSTLERSPIAGLVVIVRDGNRSRVAFLFDRERDIARSIRPMVASLQTAGASGSSSAAMPALRPMRSPDGSILAALPDDWRLKRFENGQLVAVGPDGAEVDQEIPFQLLDPRSPLQNMPGAIRLSYAPQPANMLVSALEFAGRNSGKPMDIHVERAGPIGNQQGALTQQLSGTNTTGGVVHRFEGVVALSQPNQYGGYMLSVKMVSAPAGSFSHDFPLLTAIYNSYRVDQNREAQITSAYVQYTKEQTQRGLAQMAAVRAQNDATFYASMQNAHAVQDSIDRSTAGFVNYLGDRNVVAGPSGAHGTMDDGYAQALVRSDPQAFRIVPVSDYRKGVDF